MGRKHTRRPKKGFSEATVTLDGSCVKDNFPWRVVEHKKSHDANMSKLHKQKAKWGF